MEMSMSMDTSVEHALSMLLFPASACAPAPAPVCARSEVQLLQLSICVKDARRARDWHVGELLRHVREVHGLLYTLGAARLSNYTLPASCHRAFDDAITCMQYQCDAVFPANMLAPLMEVLEAVVSEGGSGDTLLFVIVHQLSRGGESVVRDVDESMVHDLDESILRAVLLDAEDEEVLPTLRRHLSQFALTMLWNVLRVHRRLASTLHRLCTTTKRELGAFVKSTTAWRQHLGLGCFPAYSKAALEASLVPPRRTSVLAKVVEKVDATFEAMGEQQARVWSEAELLDLRERFKTAQKAHSSGEAAEVAVNAYIDAIGASENEERRCERATLVLKAFAHVRGAEVPHENLELIQLRGRAAVGGSLLDGSLLVRATGLSRVDALALRALVGASEEVVDAMFRGRLSPAVLVLVHHAVQEYELLVPTLTHISQVTEKLQLCTASVKACRELIASGSPKRARAEGSDSEGSDSEGSDSEGSDSEGSDCEGIGEPCLKRQRT